MYLLTWSQHSAPISTVRTGVVDVQSLDMHERTNVSMGGAYFGQVRRWLTFLRRADGGVVLDDGASRQWLNHTP